MKSRTRPVGWFSGLCLLGVVMAPGNAHAGASLFDEQATSFAPACGGQDGCWTNYLRVSDLDGDGDLDVVFVNYAGFFGSAPDAAEPLAIYENDGSGAFANVSATAVNDFEGRIRQVAIGDVDGDGDFDVFAPSGRGGSGSAFFINMGDMVFVDEYAERMPEAQPNVGATRMGDFDNDGDLDIFSADGYTSNPAVHGHIYLNDGMGNFDEVDGAIPGGFSGQDPDDVDLLDVNGDFVLDIVLNAHSGDNSLWLGNGDGTFSDASGQFPGQPQGFHYNPGVCDVDGDGDLDVWVDNQGPSAGGGGVPTEQLLINDGAGTFTDETAARVTGNPNSDDNGVVCADVDNDGDFDAVVIALSTRERLLVNDGAGNFTYAAGAFGGSTDSSLWGEFGDVTGDDRFDLVTGQGEGATIDRLYVANQGVPQDDRAPVFRAVETGSFDAADPIVIRSAIADRSVTDEGPRLSGVVGTLTGDGVEEETAVTFMGGDLFRAEFPAQAAGTYMVEICATDMAGNEGCESTQVEVTGGGGETGNETGNVDSSGDASESDSNSDTGNVSDSGSSSASATNGMTETASASGSGSGSDTDGDSAGGNGGGGGGCTTGAPTPLSLMLLVPALLGLRRRRN